MKNLYTLKNNKKLHSSYKDYVFLYIYFPVYKYEIDSIFLNELEKTVSKTVIGKKFGLIQNSIGIYEKLYGKIII